MFLLGKSFKETLCSRNVKTSVIRSRRKGWETGGPVILSLQETPCNSLSWLSRALMHHVSLVIGLCIHFLLGSPVTLWRSQVPLGKFTAAAVKAETAAPKLSWARPVRRTQGDPVSNDSTLVVGAEWSAVCGPQGCVSEDIGIARKIEARRGS